MIGLADPRPFSMRQIYMMLQGRSWFWKQIATALGGSKPKAPRPSMKNRLDRANL